MELDSPQLAKFNHLFLENAQSWEIHGLKVDERESEFTGREVIPRVNKWCKELRLPALYVKGDGVTHPDPLYAYGISFFPDVTIKGFQNKYLALEVKILTGSDPGGSLCKAIGQAQMYHLLGFSYSHAIVIDLRNHVKSVRFKEKAPLGNNTSLLIFS